MLRKAYHKVPSIFIIATFIAGLIFGMLWGRPEGVRAESRDELYRKLDVFAKVLHYVDTSYVKEVDQQELIYGAIKGMLETLDAHTMFMPPDVYREMKIDTTGEFQGLGLVIEKRDASGELTVIAPMESSPAVRAGIKPGDRILKIDGKPTYDMTLQQAVAVMRGPVGTKVTLSIKRGQADPEDVPLVRGMVKIRSVQQKLLARNFGYVRIKSFQERTAYYVRAAIARMEMENQGALLGLVLDLRDNPGGLLEEAVKVADLFIEKGLIVSTEARNATHIEQEHAHQEGTRDLPLVLLLNGGSASASEIVAGALQDSERAVVIGTKSYGKGSVQNIIDLEDGSGLKLTVAYYYTPKHRSIQEVGIMPDIFVGQKLTANQSGLEEGMLKRVPGVDIEQDDSQLWVAYHYLEDKQHAENGRR